MTEKQKKLMPYVETRVRDILGYKKKHNIFPELAIETEIVAEIRNDVLECMRELHRKGSYRAIQTLNFPALIEN